VTPHGAPAATALPSISPRVQKALTTAAWPFMAFSSAAGFKSTARISSSTAVLGSRERASIASE